MADIELVIKIPEVFYEALNQLSIISCGRSNGKTFPLVLFNAIKNGTVLPEGHGRLGDLDELEQRISNFVEHDAKITDEYTVARQRFIVDGIRQTSAIIEADKAERSE